ncbi:MAG TPA: acetolactate decarboxylase [Phototrophicaceae bacterium]|nr:acetolactate decarboxylase [Phototrophicaceae bacterium]
MTNRSCLLIYNTVDRLLRGDLFHTVATADVLEDLAAYPDDYPLVGIGTTSWLKRNGEVIAEGTARSPRFLWADPESSPVGQVIDVCWQRPSAGGTTLVTPRLDANDQQANFPFLAVAVGDPAQVLRWDITDTPDLHEWLAGELARHNVGVAGIQICGRFGQVDTTDAYNVPLGGVDLSHGYTGDQVFRYGHYQGDDWLINGVFAANPSLQPFISVANRPLHLHGYRAQQRDGGHIVHAEAVEASVTVWPLVDLVLRIHDVAQAMMPVKPGST